MSPLRVRTPLGEEATFDLFSSKNINNNLLITGESGIGKTTLAAALATSIASQGHAVRIAVIDNDYHEFTRCHDVHYQLFSVFRPISLNPFSSVVSWDDDRLGVNAVFANIVRQNIGSTNAQLHQILDYVQESVGNAWSTHLNEADIVTVFKSLETCKGIPSRIQSIAESALTPFLPGEVYDGWLTGPAIKVADKPHVLFDLENLRICEPLFKAVVPALLHTFCTDAAHNSETQPRLLILDDLWNLNIPTATMNRLLRCGEQQAVSVVSVVNSYDDLRHMTSGKIVIAHCANRLFYPSPAMSLNFELLVEAGIPESAIDEIDSPEGRNQHLFYLTNLKGVFYLDRAAPHWNE